MNTTRRREEAHPDREAEEILNHVQNRHHAVVRRRQQTRVYREERNGDDAARQEPERKGSPAGKQAGDHALEVVHRPTSDLTHSARVPL
jgi:hypothetical protein